MTKLEALANLFDMKKPTQTLQNTRNTITYMVNRKYNLSAFNDKHQTDFIQDFDNKIFTIKEMEKTNKELIVEDEVLKVFKEDVSDFYKKYALEYEKELKIIARVGIEPTYKVAYDYLQNVNKTETALKLNAFKLANQERLYYPKFFARILERRVRGIFGIELVNSIKGKINQLIQPQENKETDHDVWDKYYGQDFRNKDFLSDFPTFIKYVKNHYESFTSPLNALIVVFNRKVEITKPVG